MTKTRIINKNGKKYLELKVKKEKQIAEREMYLINNNDVNGLVHLSVEKKGNKSVLHYNIDEFIPLSYFLQEVITKSLFVKIVVNVLDNLKSMQTKFIDQKMLLLDLERVYVAKADNRISFVCVPIHPVEQDDSLREFLLNIVKYANFSVNEDMGYLEKYQEIINKGVNFSLFELEEYILSLTSKKNVIVCPMCKANMEQKTSFCLSCGCELNNSRKELAGIKNGNDLNHKSYNGIPFLLRKKNGERVKIDKTPFRIGKEKDCDFHIDNSAISRYHLDFIIKNQRCFIVDLNSTNCTFVDGDRIPSMIKKEIFPGCTIMLADEEFIFLM